MWTHTQLHNRVRTVVSTTKHILLLFRFLNTWTKFSHAQKKKKLIWFENRPQSQSQQYEKFSQISISTQKIIIILLNFPNCMLLKSLDKPLVKTRTNLLKKTSFREEKTDYSTKNRIITIISNIWLQFGC